MEKTILVTGASRGIGKAIATVLAGAGYGVVVHYHQNAEMAEALVQQFRAAGGNARSLGFDVADRAQCKRVLEADVQEHGAYYGVVCNAGITHDNAFPAMSGDEWDAVIHTNLDAFYNVLHPLVMPMVQRRAPARIVTIASISGLAGNRGQCNYSAAKAGIIGATKALALELAKRQITVNCVAPGLIETDMIDDHIRDEALKMIPMRRIGRPEEVAFAVKYLMSEEAAYVTRQVISVNGGML